MADIDFIQKAIHERRSIRKFDPRPVEREKILRCIEAARLAPSAENVQPWHFLILDDPQIKEAFADEVFSGVYRPTLWAKKAPVIVVILAEPDFIANKLGRMIQGIQYYLIDIGIAGEHFVLQAQEIGLATCWIGWFHYKKAERFLKIPRRMRICSLLALGYPNPEWKPGKQKRKLIERIHHFNSL